jgi:hypothetical protein
MKEVVILSYYYKLLVHIVEPYSSVWQTEIKLSKRIKQPDLELIHGEGWIPSSPIQKFIKRD